MILENELEVLSPSRLETRSSGPFSVHPSIKIQLAAFAVFLSAVVLLQVLSGAYRAEFGGYPDEPAHYVTSLMVHNYIADHKLVSPIQFAQNYYKHYPKVALGHWPPVLYIVQAIWMLLFSASRASVRLELAFTSAVLAFAVYREAWRWVGSTAAVLAGLLTVCVPLIQTYSDEEMAENLLVLMCFLSALYFARYLETERLWPCILFGLFFSLAVLTKGSGWLLAFVPPAALLLTHKLHLLRRAHLWISLLIIGVLCLPWQLMTMHLAEQGWEGTKPSLAYTLSALWQFLVILTQISGPLLSLFILIGMAILIWRPMGKQAVAPAPAAMFALILGVWLFHSIVPAGVEDRKMVIAVPALILFIFFGGRWFAERLPLKGRSAKWRYALVAIIGGASFFLTSFTVPREHHYGYIEAARFITDRPALRNSTILVSSSSIGEGLLISEIAMREPHPSCVIIRGTKALARVNWNGSVYRSIFSTPAELLQYLDARRVDVVAFDNFESENRFKHNELLKEAIAQSGRFSLLGTFSGFASQAPGYIFVYKLLPPAGSVGVFPSEPWAGLSVSSRGTNQRKR